MRSTARTFSSAARGIGVGDGDGRGEIAEGDVVAAELLQRQVGVERPCCRRRCRAAGRGWLYITSRSSAVTDLRLLNHCRRSRVSALVASVLSSAMKRVIQR